MHADLTGYLDMPATAARMKAAMPTLRMLSAARAFPPPDLRIGRAYYWREEVVSEWAEVYAQRKDAETRRRALVKAAKESWNAYEAGRVSAPAVSV